jgi:tetratricopeptide (TPR) repeat protein
MAYSLGMEYFVFGSGADHFANLLGLGRGWSGPRGPDYSHAEALEKRGDLDGAVEIYKEAIFTDRRHPLAYLKLAGIRVRMGPHEEAIDILRRSLATARFTPHGEAMAIREIHEIFSTKLGDPARAAPDLARYLDRHPGAQYGKWARRELAHI